MRTFMIVGTMTLVCGALLACRDAASPSTALSDGGSTTPPGDYMGTGTGGLGDPASNVGSDGGNLPNVYGESKHGTR